MFYDLHLVLVPIVYMSIALILNLKTFYLNCKNNDSFLPFLIIGVDGAKSFPMSLSATK